MTNTGPLPGNAVRTTAIGDARVKLTMHRREHRMLPLLCFTDNEGHYHAVALTTADVRGIYEDLRICFGADQQQVTSWFTELQLQLA
ncbi:hypothetical protein [Mycolicibacterium frederiksbergense]|uniref:hypothetical protein n=1 Tax=Mycolicibacterium frederiksbergense TaxID=117567 RepID=UPI00265C1167|nr:hypothetical protein [Mycolicibacterium frederiksbergense]MDO0977186.1 hypothetical protein [Mycolicibacterium frederiksbergense]